MKFFLTITILFFYFPGLGQSVSLALEKNRMLLGEPVKLIRQTTVQPGENLQFFYFDTLPHFEVLESFKTDTQQVAGKWQLMQTLYITSWDSGRWNFPLEIVDGKPRQTMKVDVVYTSPWDPGQPYHDIKGITPVEPSPRSPWWWYVIGAVILIALFLLFFPQSKKETVRQLDIQAYKKAMDQLNQLEKIHYPVDEPKLFYVSLVQVFRNYLKEGKGIQSLSKTTDDLALRLKELPLTQHDLNVLLQTLRLTDLVKFAKYQPGEEENKNALHQIRTSITQIEQQHVV